MPARLHIMTLGCARNDTDSEMLAARLSRDFALTPDPADADVVLVNTCGFVEAAKKDSIDTLLALSDLRRDHQAKIVAAGCLAQRYRDDLAQALPEVDAVLTFADYAAIGRRLRDVMDGRRTGPDPTAASPDAPWQPGERRRLDAGPYAPLKIASGCDRRCAFCAIPAIRGAYRSRPVGDIVAEAGWLVGQGVKEVMLVSENTSSYGKDRGEPRALETLLGRLAAVDGLDWVRLSYLQPAEVRPGLLEAIASTPNVAPYFDLSFQHASGRLLKSMRRFGDARSFLDLLAQVRERSPLAGVRSNFILGFPGESDEDVAVLHEFLAQARLDAVGVFAYSDEEGTPAHDMAGHVPPETIDERVSATLDLAAWLTDSRAAERIGEPVSVLVESTTDGVVGRAAHQGPEVDGTTTLDWPADRPRPAVGDIVRARVTGATGVDLTAAPR